MEKKIVNLDAGPVYISRTIKEIIEIYFEVGEHDELERFLKDHVQTTELRVLLSDPGILELYMKHKMYVKEFNEIIEVLKTRDVTSDQTLLKLWDEAHYNIYRSNHCRGRPLTAVQKFRIRQRNPPPTGRCQRTSHPGLRTSTKSASILSEWLQQNWHNPYPSKVVKQALARKSGLTNSQVITWFTNARRNEKRRAERDDHKKVTSFEEGDASTQAYASVPVQCFSNYSYSKTDTVQASEESNPTVVYICNDMECQTDSRVHLMPLVPSEPDDLIHHSEPVSASSNTPFMVDSDDDCLMKGSGVASTPTRNPGSPDLYISETAEGGSTANERSLFSPASDHVRLDSGRRLTSLLNDIRVREIPDDMESKLADVSKGDGHHLEPLMPAAGKVSALRRNSDTEASVRNDCVPDPMIRHNHGWFNSETEDGSRFATDFGHSLTDTTMSACDSKVNEDVFIQKDGRNESLCREGIEICVNHSERTTTSEVLTYAPLGNYCHVFEGNEQEKSNTHAQEMHLNRRKCIEMHNHLPLNGKLFQTSHTKPSSIFTPIIWQNIRSPENDWPKYTFIRQPCSSQQWKTGSGFSVEKSPNKRKKYERYYKNICNASFLEMRSDQKTSEARWNSLKVSHECEEAKKNVGERQGNLLDPACEMLTQNDELIELTENNERAEMLINLLTKKRLQYKVKERQLQEKVKELRESCAALKKGMQQISSSAMTEGMQLETSAAMNKGMQPESPVAMTKGMQPESSAAMDKEVQQESSAAMTKEMQQSSAAIAKEMQTESSAAMTKGMQPESTKAMIKEMQPKYSAALTKEMQPKSSAAMTNGMQSDSSATMTKEKQPELTAAMIKEMQPKYSAALTKEMQPESSATMSKEKQPESTAAVSKGNQPESTASMTKGVQHVLTAGQTKERSTLYLRDLTNLTDAEVTYTIIDAEGSSKEKKTDMNDNHQPGHITANNARRELSARRQFPQQQAVSATEIMAFRVNDSEFNSALPGNFCTIDELKQIQIQTNMSNKMNIADIAYPLGERISNEFRMRKGEVEKSMMNENHEPMSRDASLAYDVPRFDRFSGNIQADSDAMSVMDFQHKSERYKVPPDNGQNVIEYEGNTRNSVLQITDAGTENILHQECMESSVGLRMMDSSSVVEACITDVEAKATAVTATSSGVTGTHFEYIDERRIQSDWQSSVKSDEIANTSMESAAYSLYQLSEESWVVGGDSHMKEEWLRKSRTHLKDTLGQHLVRESGNYGTCDPMTSLDVSKQSVSTANQEHQRQNVPMDIMENYTKQQMSLPWDGEDIVAVEGLLSLSGTPVDIGNPDMCM